MENQLPNIPVERVVKDDSDPMKEEMAFMLKGHVYKVIQSKTRGRHVIKHMGVPQQEAANG